MNILLPLIVLIILAVIYAGSLNNARSRLYVVVVVLILILLLCWLQMRSSKYMLEGFEMTGYAPLGYKLKIDDANPAETGCDGYNYMNINNQISPLGTYDGLRFPLNLSTAPLMNKVFINSPVGDDIQLTEDPASKYFPSIDGTPDGEKHLFVFAKNNYGGGCHSQYSSDMGMLCPSKEQVNMFMGRGKNLTPPQEYPGM